eukprot:sb/3466801/
MGKKLFLLSLIILAVAICYSRNTVLSDGELKSSLKGKVVVICGASSGIGEETAYQYARAGAKLVLSARSEEKLLNVKSKCEGAQSIVVIVQDFSKVEEMEDYARKIFAIHPTIDVLLLNHAAKPASPWLSDPKQQSPSFNERVFKINVLSFIELTRIFMPVLEMKSGQIHVTNSISGILPFYKTGLYVSTKHALNGFYKSLQQELLLKKSPVTVTIFTLGLILTKETHVIVAHEMTGLPGWMKGDLEETGRLMASCAVTRPADVDYPWAFNKLTRALLSLGVGEKVLIGMTLRRKTYEDVVRGSKEAVELSRQMDFQMGNRV